MSHYRHLNIEEREKLYLMREQGLTFRYIAAELGRSPSTCSRELRRNKAKCYAYNPSKAQKYYEKRRAFCGRKLILYSPEKRERIRRLIQEAHWSPEEISNRLRIEGDPLQMSYSSIYRAIRSGLFDANKRAAERSRKRSFAYHLRRKGKKKHGKGEKTGKASNILPQIEYPIDPPGPITERSLGISKPTLCWASEAARACCRWSIVCPDTRWRQSPPVNHRKPPVTR